MMKKYGKNGQISKVEEEEPFMITFTSQEEADLYRLRKDMNRSDMEKFRLFCRMMRIGKMLSSAKIIK
jgi:hypothetical protein